MKHVALLRGINIGGRNKIDMKTLKKTFENAGMEDVATYINSGNIIFTDEGTPKVHLPGVLEQAIREDFGLDIRVLIRSKDEIEAINDALPDSWKNDKGMKSDVLFLWEDIDDPALLEDLKIHPEFDTVIYKPGAVLWSVMKVNAGKSGITKMVGTEIYRHMTVRNVNTFRKIHNLMKDE
ncbi:DUF1697 domain-containing protein [Lacicoccus alkaliphilus]|uniref:Uncharacterized conserved protein, DUF1697 family n=1 Tax=Lacicoccus alkaliphilus DSM 16010 TaxID=1123231 RepID=A0A1M7ABF4_9BACL|nr:DUF1697 domain-containing protein [Salinicoccus alkaliphilus]SHL40074.1 Uncharacterized conserved protein, DUF1697 family [Salinicoccus alkaliphilus DSM 16010]